LSAAPEKVTKVVVFTKAFCPYCSMLKNDLRKRGITFDTVDLTDDSTRQAFYENTGTSSVPQLYVVTGDFDADAPEGTRLGGWSEVNNAWETLDNLIAGG
jgi:glutaredoxin